MSEWIDVGPLADLQRARKRVVKVGEDDVVLFAVGERVHALADLCVHKQKKLSKGLIFKGKIICPGHQWAFDLDTGWVDEWSMCQPTYATRIEDGRILLDPTPRTHAERPACLQPH